MNRYKHQCKKCGKYRVVSQPQHSKIMRGDSSGNCLKCGENSGRFAKGMDFTKSDEHKRKIGESNKRLDNKLRGSNSPHWKGGITPINTAIRNSLEYKLWRTAIFERDKYTCIWCGKKSGNGKTVVLNSDHIKPFSLFPELRFAIDNGRTLCKECHMTTSTYGRQPSKN